MTILKTFYYVLWKNMPIWLYVISACILFGLIHFIMEPKISLICGFQFFIIFFLTNLVYSAFFRIKAFKNTEKLILKIVKLILYIFVAAIFTTFVEFIYQAFYYPIFLKTNYFFPFYAWACLVLSNFGSYPAEQHLKESVIYNLSMGFGFTSFLLAVSIINTFILKYLSESILPQLTGVIVLLIIMVLSKFRANISFN